VNRLLTITVIVMFAAILGLGVVSPAIAAKPQKVIEYSNGFPSGEHYNLNIHGKKEGFSGCDDSGGSSIFMAEYGTGTIEFVSNRKASIESLTALDKCAEQFDGNSAKVQVPYENEGYYVFWRILAKPNNGNLGEPSSVVLYPRMDLLTLCNDDNGIGEVIEGFDQFTSCDDVNAEGIAPLGVITKDGKILDPDGEELKRFGDYTKGKGKSKAIDITDMFLWTGVVCDVNVGVNDDDEITIEDFDADESGIVDNTDMALLGLAIDLKMIGNLNGTLEADELLEFLSLVPECEVFDTPTWIFTIADLVIHGFDYENKGSKLTQIRFYPVATTEFTR